MVLHAGQSLFYGTWDELLLEYENEKKASSAEHRGVCDDLRCDLKSCRKSNIYSPQHDGVHMIASASNDVLQFRSDGKFLQKAPS
jgi:hypothetical protein